MIAKMARLNRCKEVRVQQAYTFRNLKRKLSDTQAARCDDETADLTISELKQLATLYDVPIAELIEDNPRYGMPIEHRTRLLRLYKTVRSIREIAKVGGRMDLLAQQLEAELLEAMPELGSGAGVDAWPKTGQRRTLEEFGRVCERQVSDHAFQMFNGARVF